MKFSWPYLIGPTGDDGSGWTIFGYFIFMDFTQCTCFIALGAHLVYVAGRDGKNSQSHSRENSDYEGFIQPRRLRFLTVLRAILCTLCIIACVAGYLSADINHQKLGVLNWFFPTALLSAFIYLIAIWVVTTDSEIVAWRRLWDKLCSHLLCGLQMFFWVWWICVLERTGDNISANLGVSFQAHLQKAPSRGDARGVTAN